MDTITKKSFKSLTKTEQVVMVIKSGKKLLTRQDGKYYVKLYLISKLFVEILYETNKSTIVKIGLPTEANLLQNYDIDKGYLNQLIHN